MEGYQVEPLASASWGEPVGYGRCVKNEWGGWGELRLFIRQRDLNGSQSWMDLTWSLAQGREREDRFETVLKGPSQARWSQQG